MRRAVLAVTILIAFIAACDGSPSESGTSGTTTTVDVGSTTSTVAADGADRLVIATSSGDVAVLDGRGTMIRPIEAPPGAVLRQPVWLGGDAIVVSRSTPDEAALMAFDARTGDVEWEAAMETPPFFYLPAPPGGAFATTSLRNNVDGTGLVAELVGTDGSVTAISTASPFYASWSPDGRELATHVQQAILSIRREGATETIAQPTGVFQAPAWTPDGIVTLRTVDGSQLVSRYRDGSFEDLAEVAGPVRFTVSGERIAIQSAPDGDDDGVRTGLGVQDADLPRIPAGRLVVLDIPTGSVDPVHAQLTPMFQWDPSGTHLLYATVEDGASLDFAWHTWSDGEVADHGAFRVQPEWFRDLVPFFDQYDQSVSFWSADGDRFAYPAVEDGRPVVVVEPLDDGDVVTIPDATWASWAPGS